MSTATATPQKPAHRTVSRLDVARAAGVSVTTVTHAINPPPGARVSPDTRDRVIRIAKELGYRPNFLGRALVSGKTSTVGLLQPSHDALFRHFYQEMIIGMVREMEPDDYHPLMLFRSPDHHFLKVITQGRVDGMFVLQSDMETTHIEKLIETKIPTVVVNKGCVLPADVPAGCVHSDHARMMKEVVTEFVNLGCRNILAIHDHRFCDANRQMFDAFVEVTRQYADKGLVGTTFVPIEEEFPVQVRNLIQSGQRWEGVYIDMTRFGTVFLDEAHKLGLQAGHDFHLITSDIDEGATTKTQEEIAVYWQQGVLVGQEAWRLLHGLIEGTAQERRVLVPYKRHEVRAASHTPA